MRPRPSLFCAATRLARPRITARGISSASFFPLDQPTQGPSTSLVPPPLPHTSIKPPTPTYFTSKPGYFISCQNLENGIKALRAELWRRGVLKRAEEDSDRGDAGAPESWGWERTWKVQEDMGEMFGDHFKLSITEYKRITKALSDLASLIPPAALADQLYKEDAFRRSDSSLFGGENAELVPMIHRNSDAGAGFTGTTRAKGGDLAARPPRLTGKMDTPVDDYGRASAFGRRKESSARVWMIRVLEEGEPSMLDVVNSQFADVAHETKDRDRIGRILINNKPLTSFSNSQIHKATILRPLILTGQLGRYNIFGVTRGGGLTGQSGSLALAISRCLVLLGRRSCEKACRFHYFVSRLLMIYVAKLLTRDSRMVERKKWGRHKSRKGVRLLFSSYGTLTNPNPEFLEKLGPTLISATAFPPFSLQFVQSIQFLPSASAEMGCHKVHYDKL
ncbi:ribosomal protein S5 domain 2-like protein [Atractiella rhizophila]|nr:ribosomal protein S5 domain 2-like protein [Atractiella rhizophila]